MKPDPPLVVPIRTMVEIAKVKPRESMIEGFAAFSKDALSERTIIISPFGKSKLSNRVRSVLDKYRIDYVDIEQIKQINKKSATKGIAKPELKRIYEYFSAPMLAKYLSDIALQEIPSEIAHTANELGLKPWQLFEDAVFAIFHSCFGFTVRKYGRDLLFEHEPEGIVITNSSPPEAFIYECKSARQSYKMTAQDELTYIDYIQRKRDEINVLEKAELKYFLILSPDFSGDIARRRESIFRKTQVLPVFMPAKTLSALGLWAFQLPNDVKRLLGVADFFKLKKAKVSLKDTEDYIKKFERRTRNRY
jgi:hypothetical protein